MLEFQDVQWEKTRITESPGSVQSLTTGFPIQTGFTSVNGRQMNGWTHLSHIWHSHTQCTTLHKCTTALHV